MLPVNKPQHLATRTRTRTRNNPYITTHPQTPSTTPQNHHGQQPCLLWLVGQGASAVGVPVGFGDNNGEGRPYRLPLGTLTANASITLVCTRDDRSISMVPRCPNPLHTITQ